MQSNHFLSRWLQQKLENLRLRLSHAEALPQLALIGVISGVVTGLVIVAFRFLIEQIQASFLPNHNIESYEQLDLMWRFLLPVLAAMLIGLLYRLIAGNTNLETGIVHVMERLAYHQGYLPFRNLLLQFFGAALAIIGGFSVGREGPSVHLGAASSSLLGRYIRLPNNSIRILIACGSAAAIAASFNTPLAGVIFAMEVVMMEYTIAGFTPVILAAVCATAITRAIFEDKVAFLIPDLKLEGLIELPYIILCGVIIGMLAAAFIKSLEIVSTRTGTKHTFLKLMLAGVITGVFAIYVPEIMGIGYDTVYSALTGSLINAGLYALLVLLIVKMLATTIALGLGIPAGLIGPVLFCGAVAGLILGMLAKIIFTTASSEGYYALLGMGAMMGATLQAPLAALTAMIELTYNRDIILPGMLIIISASMTSRVIFGKQSVFITLMKARGLDYRSDPLTQSLLRVGVASAMDREIQVVNRYTPVEKLPLILDTNPHWIVITEDGTALSLLPTTDLARKYLEITQQTSEQQAQVIESDTSEVTENDQLNTLDLMSIPAKRLQLKPVTLQSNLQQALEELKQSGAEALYITGAGKHSPIYGILTRELIEASYHKGL